MVINRSYLRSYPLMPELSHGSLFLCPTQQDRLTRPAIADKKFDLTRLPRPSPNTRFHWLKIPSLSQQRAIGYFATELLTMSSWDRVPSRVTSHEGRVRIETHAVTEINCFRVESISRVTEVSSRVESHKVVDVMPESDIMLASYKINKLWNGTGCLRVPRWKVNLKLK